MYGYLLRVRVVGLHWKHGILSLWCVDIHFALHIYCTSSELPSESYQFLKCSIIFLRNY